MCQAIQNQSIPPELDHSDPTIFGVTMAVQFEFISSEIVQNYLGSMNVPVALWIAGCEDDAMAYVSSERKRRLQEEDREGTVEYSELEPWGVDGKQIIRKTMAGKLNRVTTHAVSSPLLFPQILACLSGKTSLAKHSGLGPMCTSMVTWMPFC